jgi:hypothetical protein
LEIKEKVQIESGGPGTFQPGDSVPGPAPATIWLVTLVIALAVRWWRQGRSPLTHMGRTPTHVGWAYPYTGAQWGGGEILYLFALPHALTSASVIQATAALLTITGHRHLIPSLSELT